MIAEIAITLGFTILFIVWIFFGKHFKVPGLNQKTLVSLFLLKLTAGVALALLYTYYYNPASADMFKYYNGGQALYSALEESPSDYFKIITGVKGNEPQLHKYYVDADHWYKQYDYGLYNDNRTMIRFNAILSLISGGRFYVHVAIMAFISFVGSFWLFLGIKRVSQLENNVLIFGVFLIPTVLIWSSALLKEGLLLFSLGALFLVSINMRDRFRWWQIPVWILAASLMFLTKFYVLLCLIPSIAFLWVTAKIRLKKPMVVLIPILVVILTLFATSKYYTEYDLPSLIEHKQNDFVKYVNTVEDAGSNINIPDIEPGFWGLIKHMPQAYINSFFRPHIAEVSLGLSMLAALENLALLALIIMAIVFFRKPPNPTRTFVLAAFTFVFFLFGLTGLTTPNLGALVRYKMPALPFLFLALYALIGNKRLPKKIQKLKIFID